MNDLENAYESCTQKYYLGTNSEDWEDFNNVFLKQYLQYFTKLTYLKYTSRFPCELKYDFLEEHPYILDTLMLTHTMGLKLSFCEGIKHLYIDLFEAFYKNIIYNTIESLDIQQITFNEYKNYDTNESDEENDIHTNGYHVDILDNLSRHFPKLKKIIIHEFYTCNYEHLKIVDDYYKTFYKGNNIVYNSYAFPPKLIMDI